MYHCCADYFRGSNTPMRMFSRSLSVGIVVSVLASACSEQPLVISRSIPESDSPRGPTDCSTFITTPQFQMLDIPRWGADRLRSQYERHYRELNLRVLREEARQLLLKADLRTGGVEAASSGKVSRFERGAIPIYVYAFNRSDRLHAEIAIDRLNMALAPSRLVPEFFDGTTSLHDRETGSKKGIHLYFGSKDCMHKVFSEQADIAEDEFIRVTGYDPDRLGGITLRQVLTIDGISTGRLQRSFVIVFNIRDKLTKQSVVEHELIHALGIIGHTRSTLYSRMSVEAASLAPISYPSDFDDKLVSVLYRDLNPGDENDQVKRILRQKFTFRRNTLATTADCIKDFAGHQNVGRAFSTNELLENMLCDFKPSARPAN